MTQLSRFPRLLSARSLFKTPSLGVTGRFALALLVAPVLAPALTALTSAPAWSRGAVTDDADPGINHLGKQINQVLVILRARADAASQRCLVALKDMHKAEDEMDRIHNRNDPDLPLARDVLGSSMEESLRACGTDAAELCARSAPNNPSLNAACTRLPPIPEEDPSLELGQSGSSVLGP